jgi:hypothetical protein
MPLLFRSEDPEPTPPKVAAAVLSDFSLHNRRQEGAARLAARLSKSKGRRTFIQIMDDPKTAVGVREDQTLSQLYVHYYIHVLFATGIRKTG